MPTAFRGASFKTELEYRSSRYLDSETLDNTLAEDHRPYSKATPQVPLAEHIRTADGKYSRGRVAFPTDKHETSSLRSLRHMAFRMKETRQAG